MKAIVNDRYGPADDLALRDVETPEPTNHEVLVEVHAAGIDPGVWHTMTGLPYLVRLAGYGVRAPKQAILGHDLAGRIAAVGKDVAGYRVGDAVYGACDGALAEYAVATVEQVSPMPDDLSFTDAAATPISGRTALEALRDHGRVHPGQRAMIIGAAGGIGTFAVQLAKALGADVTAVCSTAKVGLASALGADAVIDYTREELTRDGGEYDLVIDTAGNRPLTALRQLLQAHGTLVIVGGEGGGRWVGGADRQLRALLLSPFVKQRLRAVMAKEHHEDLAVLTRLIETDAVRPVVDRTFPLPDAAAAIDYLHAGRSRGKVVVVVRED
jgi:NADPH:quinone reductase-like Zn-dependent oxidoreductase